MANYTIGTRHISDEAHKHFAKHGVTVTHKGNMVVLEFTSRAVYSNPVTPRTGPFAPATREIFVVSPDCIIDNRPGTGRVYWLDESLEEVARKFNSYRRGSNEEVGAMELDRRVAQQK